MKATRKLWKWEAIIDWMLAHPGGLVQDCAKDMGLSNSYLSTLINTDMFRAQLQARRQAMSQMHDLNIIDKSTKIAHASLDAILQTLEKKKDAVPLETLKDISESALLRLGYGTKPSMNVHVGNNVTTNNVVLPVSAADLEEARMALRQVQGGKVVGSTSASLPLGDSQPPLLELEAEPVKADDEEASLAATPSVG